VAEDRRYERCAECRRRVMLPRWVDGTLYAGDTGAEWYCMDCSGESATERIEWARDEAEAEREAIEEWSSPENRAFVAAIRAAKPLTGDDLAAAQQLAADARGEIEG
jgi:hypothetical protein